MNPSGSDTNPQVRGEHANNLINELFGAWGTDENKTLELATYIKEKSNSYFEQADSVHMYFKYVCNGLCFIV